MNNPDLVQFGYFEPAEQTIFESTTVELPKAWREDPEKNKIKTKTTVKDFAIKTSNNAKKREVLIFPEPKNSNKISSIQPEAIKNNDQESNKKKTEIDQNQINGYHEEESAEVPVQGQKNKTLNKKDSIITENRINVKTIINDDEKVDAESKIKNGTGTDISTTTSNDIVDKESDLVNPANRNETANNESAKANSDSNTSWASLFTSSKSNDNVSNVLPFVETVSKNSNNEISQKLYNHTTDKLSKSAKVISPEEDDFLHRIADQLIHNETVYKSAALLPRGLTNNSNWCYINATLQALLVCAPFCHLMRSLPSRPMINSHPAATSTPILDSFVQLVKDFKPLPKRPMQRGKESRYGPSHEPRCIYDMLSLIKSNLSKQGKQEDAEEFLSCILNGIHEEMLMSTQKYANEFNHVVQQSDSGYEAPNYEDESPTNYSDQEDQWEEVTASRKNRSTVTRRTDSSRSAISDVFRGELRSDLHQNGQKGSATLEPFFTLPLDISSDQIWNVSNALESLARKEMVMDVTNSKTKVKGDAIKRQTLETLPPVLILHLKRFVYDKKGGSMKLDKEVQFHTDLVIGKNLISKETKKYWQDKRAYKLFAVVYHHGKNATGGHYTADVYHDRLNCWLNIDDQVIKNTNVHEVVRHNASQTPYLLYYKRTDLMAV